MVQTECQTKPITGHAGPTVIYLYCYSRPGAGFLLAHAQSGDNGVLAGITGLGQFGISELVVDDVAAIVCQIPSEKLAPLFDAEKMLERDWIVRLAMEHDRIITRIQDGAPVLPVRFGSVFSSCPVLLHGLRRARKSISGFLDYLGDQKEWTLKAIQDTRQACSRVSVEDPLFAERLENLPTSPGIRYLREKSYWADVQREVQEQTREFAEQIRKVTEAFPGKYKSLARNAQSDNGQNIIWNGAFLLGKNELAFLREQVKQLESTALSRVVRFELSGPCPPYSFCPNMENFD
jgi:hypothetical protein